MTPSVEEEPTRLVQSVALENGTSLRANGLMKSFRGRKVVKGVAIEVFAGEVVGLLGPNGAGKTTIFDMMVGLCQPDAGEITFKGESVTSLPMYKRARKGIGYLPRSRPYFAVSRWKIMFWPFWKCWDMLVKIEMNGSMPCSKNWILDTFEKHGLRPFRRRAAAIGDYACAGGHPILYVAG